MGTVWLARNETLDSPVALKLIRPGMQSDETVDRLLTEARVEAKLRHPNIVRVFDYGKTALGDAFIVMEVLEGMSLANLLRQRGRLDAIEAVRLVLPVIGALCHAHEHGVVHRDLKPHNIFLDRGGLHPGTKLLDFGIAKLMGDDAHRDLSLDGTLLGSPAYMAPEQTRNLLDVDHRADIWAMCVVLYEAISGAPAFSGDDHVVLRKIMHQEVPALVDSGTAGSALSGILRRGLEKDPSDRFQSMRELGAALAQWLCNQGETEDLDGNRITRSWGVVPLARWANARSVTRSEMTLAQPTVRQRRYVQMIDLRPEASTSLVRTLKPHGISERAATKLRIVVIATAIVVVLTPSTIGGEPAMSVSAQQPKPIAVPEKNSVHLAQTEPVDPRGLDTASPQTVPLLPILQSRELTDPKHRPPRLTEADLGLKVPYSIPIEAVLGDRHVTPVRDAR